MGIDPMVLSRLAEQRDRVSLPLTGWQIARHVDLPRDLALAAGAEDRWQVCTGEWGRIPGTWWLRTTFRVPKEWAGERVLLRLTMHSDYPRMDLRIPWAVGLHMHFEGLLFVDGLAFHGLDPNRDEVLLTEAAEPGRVYDLAIEAYTKSPRPKFFQTSACLPDPAARGLRLDLVSLQQLADALGGEPEIGPALRKLVDQIGERLVQGADREEAMAAIRQGLAAIRGPWGETALDLIGHCHIDTAWLWRLVETRRKVGRTFATNLRYGEEFPAYRYVQSAPVCYEFCRDDYPELYADVKAAVRAGRWCPEGTMYVESDCNLPAGESLVRQLLFGKRFFREEFGIDSKVLWLPDVFGFTGALPQLLKQAGVELFYNTKVRKEGGAEQPLDAFWWEGIDGTRIMALFAKGYINWAAAGNLLDWVRSLRRKGSPPLTLMPFGFGDGGGGVAKDDLELVGRWADLGFFPKCQFTPPAAFTERMAEASASFPVRCGDLYLEWHRGTYTSVAAIKRWNRQCEQALLAAETWAARAAWMGHAYPAAELETAWRGALLNQFHDILPGSSIPEVYLDAGETAAQVLATCNEVQSQALAVLAGPGEVPLVANSLGETVTGLVEVPETLATQSLTGVDGKRLGLAWVVDASGWSLSSFVPVPGSATAFQWDGDTLVTPFWRARFRDQGRLDPAQAGLHQLYDRGRGRMVLAGQGNRFETFHDEPGTCEPWEMRREDLDRPAPVFTTATRQVVANGPLVFVVRTTYRSERSALVQDMRFYAHSPRIDFITRVDWHEHRILLKVAFPLAVDSATSRAETAFGWLPRSMKRDTPVEREQFETPMHRWVSLAREGFGVALLNDSKYGYDGLGNTLRLTLLKSAGYAQIHPDHETLDPLTAPPEPNAWADQGEHRFTYSLLPHDGDLAPVVREARLLNQPLRLVSGHAPSPSPVTVDAPNVVAEVLKQAEDGNGFILRLYEATGQATQAAVHFAGVRKVEVCDILERPVENCTVEQDRAELAFHPFEVKSLRLVP